MSLTPSHGHVRAMLHMQLLLGCTEHTVLTCCSATILAHAGRLLTTTMIGDRTQRAHMRSLPQKPHQHHPRTPGEHHQGPRLQNRLLWGSGRGSPPTPPGRWSLRLAKGAERETCCCCCSPHHLRAKCSILSMQTMVLGDVSLIWPCMSHAQGPCAVNLLLLFCSSSACFFPVCG